MKTVSINHWLLHSKYCNNIYYSLTNLNGNEGCFTGDCIGIQIADMQISLSIFCLFYVWIEEDKQGTKFKNADG